MRSSIMMVLAILFFNVCFAQKGKVQEKGVMPFGEVDKADLEARASLIDKNAEAEVIFETREQEINLWNGSLDMKIRVHRRVKIYNDKGLDEANQKIAFYSKNGLESVSKLEAQAYNLDASGNVLVAKMDKKSIYTKKVNNVQSLITFAIPEVKAGSVLEFKYEITTQRFFIEDYYFQEAIPVRYSRFKMDYPQEFHINAQFAAYLPYDSEKRIRITVLFTQCP